MQRQILEQGVTGGALTLQNLISTSGEDLLNSVTFVGAQMVKDGASAAEIFYALSALAGNSFGVQIDSAGNVINVSADVLQRRIMASGSSFASVYLR